MRRRILFVIPDLMCARSTMDDLLLARIEACHIHFLAKRGTPMDGLHEANVLQKSDLVHAAQLGLAIGALLGCVLGAVVVMLTPTPEAWQIVIVLGSAIVGALFGAWVSSMIGVSVPNSRLRDFQQAIEQGKLLLMVDVPSTRVEEIRDLLHRRHPDCEDRGIDPHVPAFP
jgi:hypothetical protein